MRPALCAVFFVSGAAALLFETLWFRQAGLALGNSVWASSLVTASFMAGLALGSVLAARHGDRLRRPLVVYSILEAVVGASGALLVVLFPFLPGILAPLLGPLSGVSLALNAARVAVSFALLMLPATAMGFTLPLLARALASRNTTFGSNLGLLYGFNTLGAVVGALAGEGVLIGAFGVRWTGAMAAGLNGVAAVGALVLARGEHDRSDAQPALPTPILNELPLLAAAFGSGAALLALEVLWFRLLQLFCAATSLAFAAMLAVVLSGIAAGGLLAAFLCRRAVPAALLPSLALLAGSATVATYASLPGVLDALRGYLLDPARVAAAAMALMFPTAVISGLLFTVIGAVLRAGGGADGATTGLLSVANTLGALVGALAAGFWLLPAIGGEDSLFAIAVLYGLVAAVTVGRGRDPARVGAQSMAVGSLALYAFCVTFFPFGLMRNHFVRRSVEPFLREDNRMVALREGLTETLSYTRHEWLGQPVDHRLVVNGFSMSGSFYEAARYMRLFVYLPVAVHPDPRSALLISYGVGVTAQALTDVATLQAIDVVDISRDILELAQQVHPVPGPMPLDDPRVRVHVEDGRFYLLTTERRYDLITGEPPPPRNNGIVNLYSKEYFELMRRRLRPGGIATYWLPVNQLELAESRAILAAFCDAFEDCSLWNGSGYDWVLMGTHGAGGPMSLESFERQWRDPVVRSHLVELGFERPELLGATFLADAPGLRAVIDGAPPLDDDHPHRLGMKFPSGLDPFYDRFAITERARREFEGSSLVHRLWPPDLRARSLGAFEEQRLVNLALLAAAGYRAFNPEDAREMLTATRLRTPVLWGLGSSARLEVIARRAAASGVQVPRVDELLGVSALADRRPGEAVSLLARAYAANPRDGRLAGLLDLARSLAATDRP